MAEAKNKVLKQARRELNYLTGSEAVRRMEELREKWERDDIAIKNRALEEGRMAGRTEGIEIGEEIGKNKGKIEEKIEIAKNLLKTGMEISKIAEVTGLSEEEIEKIKG